MTQATVTREIDSSVPVLLLGGEANALEVIRHFARRGIAVSISGGADCWGLDSRDRAEALRIPEGQSSHAYWTELLLAEGPGRFDGHVIFAMNDDAISFVLANEAALRARYRLEKFDAALRTAMLDKERTLELAEELGVPAPKHWRVRSLGDVTALNGQVAFPIMIKPVHSHLFQRALGKKLFIIEAGFDELVAKARLALEHDLAIVIVEMIPGPDDLLSSYYTYIDDTGAPLFHYTKRVFRRFPANSGIATYHATDWLPETAEIGLRYLKGIGWRGLANIEFKRDTRDGQLKLIEVNARFTAAHRLVVRSGAPIDLIAYCDLTGQPAPGFSSYNTDLRLWMPLRDLRAGLELRRLGRESLWRWLTSLRLRGMLDPMLSLRDPMPSIRLIATSLRANWQRALRDGR